MLPHIVTFITYNDVYRDGCPSIEEIRDYFFTYHTPHLIQALCKLNIALWKEPVDIGLQIKVCKLFFDHGDLNSIKKALLSHKDHRSFIFHRQQMLLAIKIALLKPNSEGVKEIDLSKLGRYLLAISEHINVTDNSFHLDLTETLKYESARQSMAKLQYFSHYGDFMHNFARAIEMWLNIPKTKRGIDLLKQFKIDIYEEFKNATGISMEEFISINFLNLSRLYELDVHTNNPKDFMLFSNFFSKTKLTPETIEKLYKPLIQDIDGFSIIYEENIKNNLKGIDKFESNFLTLTEYPIIKINQNMYIVADPQFLERRITEGPYWILLNYFSKKGELVKGRGRDLSSYFGILHQEYVYQSLTYICDKVVEIPASNKEKLCDFIGIKYRKDDIYIFVIEAKKIALSLSLEYNSDRNTTVNNLKEIFYETGFRQIFNTIQKIQSQNIKELESIELNKIKHIFPLLVIDRYIAEETLSRKLYEREFFEPLTSEFDFRNIPPITHPIFISAEEVDKIEAILEKDENISLIDILGKRHNALLKRYDIIESRQFIPNMSIAGIPNLVDHLDTFWNYLFEIKSGIQKNNRLKKIFDEQMVKVKKILF